MSEFRNSVIPSVSERFIIIEDTDERRGSVASSINNFGPILHPQIAKRRTFDNRSISSDKSFYEPNDKFSYNNRFNSPAKTFVASAADYDKSSFGGSDTCLDSSTLYSDSYRTISNNIDVSTSNSPIASPNESNQLIQGLRPHNVAFITLCSVFGTGLFITSASTLRESGPFFLFLGYVFTGLLAYQVVTALSDMATYIPLPDNFSGFAERFVDPALGFATGYAFLLTFLLFAPNQVSAATLTMSYWIDPSKISPGVWILIFISLIALVNYCKVTKYAYLVDAFITIKLTIYFILAVTFLCLICGASPKHEAIGFKYWKNPGPVTNYGDLTGASGKIVAIIMATVKSVWSYVGIESFSVAAIETINPRETIPKARKVLFGLLFPVYLIMAFLIGLCVSSNDPSLILSSSRPNTDTAKSSVISIALYNASLGVMGNFVNATLLIFIFSAANTGFYLSTRILYGLSASGMAPKIFTRTTKTGVPIYSFLLVLSFNFLAFISAQKQAVQTYHYFVDATSLFSLINWSCILFTHIRFLKAFKKQGMIHEFRTYVYNSTTSIIPSTIALVTIIILIFVNNLGSYLAAAEHKFNPGEFVAGMIAIPIFACLYLGFKIYYRTSMVKLEEADLFFYRDVVDARERAYLQHKMGSSHEREKMNFLQRFGNRVRICSVKC